MLDVGACGIARQDVQLAGGTLAHLWGSCDPAPGKTPGEDRIGAVLTGRGSLLLFVVDGATSVDPDHAIDGMLGGAWYAQAVRTALLAQAGLDLTLEERLSRTIAGVARQFGRATRAAPWPDWAWPLASVSLVELAAGRDGSLTGTGLHLGDSPVYRVGPGLTGAVCAVFRQSSGPEARLTGAGAQARATTLDILRRRRSAQHAGAPPPVCGLDPAVAARATRSAVALEPGATLVLLSDGLARAWEEYRLADADTWVRSLARGGYTGRLQELRAFERDYASRAERLFKASDDCAVLLCALAPGTDG